jgi:hypothetical protein
VQDPWQNNLKKLVNTWHLAESILPKLTEPEQKVHKEIYEKLEMPREWYETLQKEAYLKNVVVDVKIVEKRILLALSLTLLVYERLSAFYQ